MDEFTLDIVLKLQSEACGLVHIIYLSHINERIEAMQTNDETDHQQKKRRIDNMEILAAKAVENDIQNGEYVDQFEIRQQVMTIIDEIELQRASKESKFAVDGRLVGLPIATLVAIEGHLLGASSILSAIEFDAQVNKIAIELRGKVDVALTRCNESRYLRMMLAADYIALDNAYCQTSQEDTDQRNTPTDTDGRACAGNADESTTPTNVGISVKPSSQPSGIFPKISPHSVMCNFGGRQYRLEGLSLIHI